ncbi:V-type ATP synthase subunit E [Deinococcus yavapaiensis]|uniref:V-type proton ATPase subunit E n=1 Tax=Deinococcus yavapaiensis KR-236 TaxID=694435 RepID=A0A318S485_9DEIO|nr:V-type ATP synthase subunit E [Deinococcus yavapaiensis]PYE51179.1 V/A-type H+-transporting ATPase subunit E [Deinococcus yavapaiensis KR-236]
MALDQLLENEARAEIERIRASGREQAEAIVRAASEQAQATLDSRKRLLDSQLQAGVVRAQSSATLEVSAARLNASDSGMKRAFEIAEQQLQGVTGLPEYREILSRLIAEAREAIGDIEALEVNPADVALAMELAPGLEVRPNPAVSGGVRAVGKSGKSGITNTLLGRLARVRDAIAPQVAQVFAE